MREAALPVAQSWACRHAPFQTLSRAVYSVSAA